MLDTLIQWDKALFLTLNGWNNAFFDIIMPFASGKLSWLPLYVFILFMAFYRRSWKRALLIIAGALVVFALCDSMSTFAKNYFERFRPLYDPEIKHLVRALEGGGSYGFFSGHAANTFGLAMFTSLVFRKKWYTVMMFCWAVLVSYSRIYVGKHFPGDLLVGALFGMLVASLIYLCYRKSSRFLEARNINS